MKTAKLFLIGMYVHLGLNVAVPIAIFALCHEDGWNTAGVGLLLFYLLMIGVVQILGWIAAAAACSASRRGELDRLRRGWRLLKLGSIPFYILNFLYSFFMWFILVGASRGILIILVPIPIAITWLMIVQSGCVGNCCLTCLKNRYGEGPGGVHRLFQFLPVLDVLSTLWVLRKWRRELEDREETYT